MESCSSTTCRITDPYYIVTCMGNFNGYSYVSDPSFHFVVVLSPLLRHKFNLNHYFSCAMMTRFVGTQEYTIKADLINHIGYMSFIFSLYTSNANNCYEAKTMQEQ